MNALWAIYRRDLSRMAHSSVIAMIAVLFLLIMGGLFFVDFFQSVQELSLRSFFSQAPLLLSIFCPALTMGLVAEERRLKTLDILQAAPVRAAHIVVAKCLAALTVLAIVLAFTLSYPATLSALGPLDWGPVAGGYIALLMLGGVYIAIGVLASAIAREQVTAFLLSFFVGFLFTFAHRLAQGESGTLATILQAVSINAHFTNIARGVVDLRDIFYALTVQAIAIVASVAVLDARQYPVKRL